MELMNKGERDFSNVRFEFATDLTKAWQDEKGKMFVEAIASDDQLDLQRDRMSKAALNKMAAASKKGVPFLSTHRDTFEFGKTVDGEIITVEEKGKPVHKLKTVIELDGEYPQARTLYKEVASGTCKRQLSIGGKLNLKNRDAVSIEMTASGLSRTINDIDLDHIAATREKHAANPRTSFTEAIAKALDEAEHDGWVPPTPTAEADVVKAAEVVEPAAADDVKAGMSFLAKLGRMIGLGKEEGGPVSTKPATATKEAAKKDETTTSTETTTTKEKEVVQAVAKLSGKKADATVHDLVNDIAILLAKRGKMYSGPKTSETETTTTMKEDDMAADREVYNALWKVRFILAKSVTGAELGAGEQQPMSAIADGGLYAPRDLSGAKVSGAYLPDKAPAGSDTNVAGSAVSDSRRDIQVGGEVKATAPMAKEAMAATMAALDRAGALPQASESMGWQKLAKSLSEGGSPADFFKSMTEEIVEKTTEVNKGLILAAVEKMAEEQKKSEDGLKEEVKKAMDSLGNALNEVNKTVGEAQARVAKLEKAGGVSQSGPRGSVDSTVTPPAPAGKKGVWGGIFAKPTSEALSSYK